MFREHRRGLLGLLQPQKAACVVPSGGLKTRNADCEYRFRPASDFYYLTGFREPDSILVLLPEAAEQQTVLFLRERDAKAETWTGRRLGVERACEELGVDAAHAIGEFWDRLPELLVGHQRIVHRMGNDPDQDRLLTEVVNELQQSHRKSGKLTPTEWLDPEASLHELRLVKDEAEVAEMRRASWISAEAHIAAMQAVEPGRNESEIDALLDYTFRRNGATGAAYNNIVAGGESACILHYIENDKALVDGELVLIDSGCEWNFYATDVTRTIPVSGRFSTEQKAIYELVLRAQKEAIELVRPGNTFVQVHDRAVGVLVLGLIELGLLAGPLEQELQSENYHRFYMHKTGHWLGLDVHDCGSYYHARADRKFEPGMAATVEPGLYIAADDSTVEARWRGIGVRIEDDILVTAGGHEILSAAIPKEVDEVEAICQGKPPGMKAGERRVANEAT
jgi:Xaa-Pro aminopeptidase